MLLGDLGEFGLIDRINRIVPGTSERVIRGSGDDAAVIVAGPDEAIVVTNDTLVEGVDFRLDTTDAARLGRKALAVNLSDIAAMGARPDHVLVSLAIPDRITVEFLTEFHEGLGALARTFSVAVIGGDVSSAPHEFVIGITAIGHAKPERVVYRDGAQAGDALVLIGTVGESSAGLEVLLGHVTSDAQVSEPLVERHLSPEPLVNEGKWLAEHGRVHALIDVSDGLAGDLGHMCHASGVGAIVERASVPVTAALSKFLSATGADADRYLFHGGEDFALIAAVPGAQAEPIITEFRERFKTPIARIGTVTSGSEVSLRAPDGDTQPFAGGFDHFRSSPA